MRHYCTYFDSNYLPQGLALYHSLEEYVHEPFILWVLCFDEQTYRILQEMALPKIHLINQADFEYDDEALLEAKQNRTQVEYYWTCTPSLPLYILKHNPEIDLVVYVDADLYFFSDPAPIFDELDKGSILIVGHRFPPELLFKESSGIYNVGLLCFRRDQSSLKALHWWRARCNEWCYWKEENGRYGDQKYLDDWPTRFEKVIVLQHKGAGLAPWNLAWYTISIQNNLVYVDDVPLIFFHFGRFKMITDQTFIHNTEQYLQRFDKRILSIDIIRHIYSPYAQILRKMGAIIREHHPDYKNPYKKVSLISWLHGLSKGTYFPVLDNSIARLIVSFGLWRAESSLLARKGFLLKERGDRKGAKKNLLAAAFRSPRVLLNPEFWRVVMH
jgi:hypothetical protein